MADTTEISELLTQLADYEVRQGANEEWGIYLRAYNVRVAIFAANSSATRTTLARMFEFANSALTKG